MTPFPDDPRPDFSWVASVSSPLGGSVGFSQLMDLRTATVSWATWSHGYTGDVYFTGSAGDPQTVLLTLPAQTLAFYLYAEPNPFETWLITATDQYGAAFSQMVAGYAGASGFGFYADAGSGQIITTMQIDYAGTRGFGIGEFGIAVVPVPGAVLLGILGLSVVGIKLRKHA